MSYGNGNGATAYQQARVMGSSSEQLVPLLYERLLADLRRSGALIRARDIEGKSERLQHAAEIVFELMSALDLEAGGELAARLSALYVFFANEIGEIGRTLDMDRLERLTVLVASLHTSWVEAAAAVARGDGQRRIS
jgi:flagellar secretion chaperone FliS